MKDTVKPKQSRGDKTPKVEMEARIQKVSDLILAGASRSQIVTFCNQKFSVHEETADRYIKEALERFAKAAAPDRKAELNKGIQRYEQLYAKCLIIQDYKTAASIQDRICKLLGLWNDTLTLKHEAGDTLTEFMKRTRAGETLLTNK